MGGSHHRGSPVRKHKSASPQPQTPMQQQPQAPVQQSRMSPTQMPTMHPNPYHPPQNAFTNGHPYGMPSASPHGHLYGYGYKSPSYATTTSYVVSPLASPYAMSDPSLLTSRGAPQIQPQQNLQCRQNTRSEKAHEQGRSRVSRQPQLTCPTPVAWPHALHWARSKIPRMSVSPPPLRITGLSFVISRHRLWRSQPKDSLRTFKHRMLP